MAIFSLKFLILKGIKNHFYLLLLIFSCESTNLDNELTNSLSKYIVNFLRLNKTDKFIRYIYILPTDCMTCNKRYLEDIKILPKNGIVVLLGNYEYSDFKDQIEKCILDKKIYYDPKYEINRYLKVYSSKPYILIKYKNSFLSYSISETDDKIYKKLIYDLCKEK